MGRKLFGLFCTGIAWGCTVNIFVMIIGIAIAGESWILTSPQGFTVNVVCGILTGIGWVVPTIIYGNDKLSYASQILIHMSIGFVIYFACSFYAGWIPTNMGIGVLITYFAIAIVGAFIVWLGFSLYYRREALKINNKIKEITSEVNL